MSKKIKLTQKSTSILMLNNTNMYGIKYEIIVKKQE